MHTSHLPSHLPQMQKVVRPGNTLTEAQQNQWIAAVEAIQPGLCGIMVPSCIEELAGNSLYFN